MNTHSSPTIRKHQVEASKPQSPLAQDSSSREGDIQGRPNDHISTVDPQHSHGRKYIISKSNQQTHHQQQQYYYYPPQAQYNRNIQRQYLPAYDPTYPYNSYYQQNYKGQGTYYYQEQQHEPQTNYLTRNNPKHNNIIYQNQLQHSKNHTHDNQYLDTNTSTQTQATQQTVQPTTSTSYQTIWTCDNCKVAVFDSFEAAVEHESTCDGVPSPQKSVHNQNKSHHQQMHVDENAEIEDTNRIIRQREKASRYYVCDVCREAFFESYHEAEKHEATCKGKIESNNIQLRYNHSANETGNVVNDHQLARLENRMARGKRTKDVVHASRAGNDLPTVVEVTKNSVSESRQKTSSENEIIDETPINHRHAPKRKKPTSKSIDQKQKKTRSSYKSKEPMSQTTSSTYDVRRDSCLIPPDGVPLLCTLTASMATELNDYSKLLVENFELYEISDTDEGDPFPLGLRCQNCNYDVSISFTQRLSSINNFSELLRQCSNHLECCHSTPKSIRSEVKRTKPVAMTRKDMALEQYCVFLADVYGLENMSNYDKKCSVVWGDGCQYTITKYDSSPGQLTKKQKPYPTRMVLSDYDYFLLDQVELVTIPAPIRNDQKLIQIGARCRHCEETTLLTSMDDFVSQYLTEIDSHLTLCSDVSDELIETMTKLKTLSTPAQTKNPHDDAILPLEETALIVLEDVYQLQDISNDVESNTCVVLDTNNVISWRMIQEVGTSQDDVNLKTCESSVLMINQVVFPLLMKKLTVPISSISSDN